MTRRPWTTGEVALLRRHYGPLADEPWTTRKVARELGRTPSAVSNAAHKLGLSWQWRSRSNLKAFARLYRLGHADAMIADLCGCHLETVRRWRRRTARPPLGRPGPRPKRAV